MPKNIGKLPKEPGYKTCWSCKQLLPVSEFWKQNRRDGFVSRCKKCSIEYIKKWRNDNPQKRKAIALKGAESIKNDPIRLDKYRRYQWNRREIVKLRTIERYGGKCTCCGESNTGFLTIDHINGGGMKHTRSLKKLLWYWLDERPVNPEEYRVMCYNCNLGRFHNGGECPHISKHPYSGGT
jgi:hypothetical protein